MPASKPEVITRFAPSPTGHLHVGGARSALFCWAFAKRYHGHFILRIEDTDAARSSDESARGIMEDLAWLGIEWDEGPTHQHHGRTIGGDPRGVGPFFQAQRLKTHYDPHIMRLVEQGKAYPAFESEAELDAEKQRAKEAKANYRYSRASYTKVSDIKERIRLIEKGEPHVIRFFSPREEIAFTDQVLGDVKVAPGEVDDFIIRRRDGFPMYNFAVVVDDHGMGITHVMRAQEHLSNTPRQIALYRAFGYAPPNFGHMPLIFNMDGSKMGKRDKAKVARKALQERVAKTGDASIAELAQLFSMSGPRVPISEAFLREFLKADNDSMDVAAAIADAWHIDLPEIQVNDFRQNGYTPEAICNFLALLGWNPGMKTPDGKDLEKFDNKFLAEHFSIERLGRTNSKFDRKKLLSFNGDDLSSLSDEEFARRWKRYLEVEQFESMSQRGAVENPALVSLVSEGGERLKWLLGAVKPRAKTLKDAERACSFLASPSGGVVRYDPDAVAKHLDANGGSGRTLLRAFVAELEKLPAFDPPSIHAALETFAKAQGLANPGPIAQAIRVAVTGGTVSPGIAEMLAVLGREESLRRIRAAT